MGRLGTFFGLVLPVLLLGVNLIVDYGGILVTIALIVWIGTGVLIAPTAEGEG